MSTVAIIGAGPLGRWLALAAARAGFRVYLEDVMPSNLHHAQEYLRLQLGPVSDELPEPPGWSEEHDGTQDGAGQGLKLATKSDGLIGTTESRALLQSTVAQRTRVHFVSTVEDAVREADLVIDCVPDELESKLEILWLLDRMCPPRTVIATPTANLSIVDLASCTYRPDKCIAIAASPRTLSEERPGSTIRLQVTPRTTPETIAIVESFWLRLGFHPAVEQAVS